MRSYEQKTGQYERGTLKSNSAYLMICKNKIYQMKDKTVPVLRHTEITYILHKCTLVYML